jgi:hypothetical protein
MAGHAQEPDEEALAGLLSELREPPRPWIEAAQQLPAARASLDDLVARARADAAYRDQLLDGLEDALRAEGREPEPQLIASLRARLIELG